VFLNPLSGPFLSLEFPAALRAGYPDSKAEELFFDEFVHDVSDARVASYRVANVTRPVLILHLQDNLVQAHLRQIKAASHNGSFLSHQ
jgi:hypothetical protein